MKLYYAPGACSQAPHIVLHELDLPHSSAVVDLRAKTVGDGESYLAINPKGAVPALDVGDGEVLTENAVILQYLGDQAPGTMLPERGLERYRVLEWLGYIATEIHKGFGPLWNPATPDEVKTATREALGKKFDYLQREVGDGPYLMGERFTLPDAYLFVVLGWTRIHQIDLGRWPGLTEYVARVAERPAVRTVLRAEGLLQEETAG